MVAFKYLVPAFAAFGLVAAQSTSTSTSICSQATATINSQADATALASSCSTVSGSIAISSSVAGAIFLDGIEQIKGDLICNGAVNLTSLSGSTLNAITGTMSLTSLTIMSTLSFPELTSVGALSWTTLNAIQELTFTTGISQAQSVLITDTALTTLNGINLMTVGSLEITNNAFLRTISTQVANITEGMIISANGPNLNLTFPNLIFAFNITVRNVSNIDIPSLSSVNSTFGIYGSYMDSILAPNLTSVGGDIAIVADASLTNVSMPLLKTIGGGLQIANNSELVTIDGFPNLATTGAISMSGNFSSAVLPALSDVKGTFNAQSSGNFSCTPFQQDKNNQVIKGTFTCSAKSNNVQASGTGGGSSTGTSTSSTTSATATKKGAASIAKVNMPAMIGLSALVGGLAHLAL